VLVSSGFRPQRTLEFIAFSGEEHGYVNGALAGKTGSHHIALDYAQRGVKVAAMLNLDSIGSPFRSCQCEQPCDNPLAAEDNSIGIIANSNIDPSLRDLQIDCVVKYTNQLPLARNAPAASDYQSFRYVRAMLVSTAVS